jgi:hypothetical protein
MGMDVVYVSDDDQNHRLQSWDFESHLNDGVEHKKIGV